MAVRDLQLGGQQFLDVDAEVVPIHFPFTVTAAFQGHFFRAVRIGHAKVEVFDFQQSCA